MSKTIIRLNTYEDKLIAYLCKERGWRKSDVIRVGIRTLYMQEFPNRQVRKGHGTPNPSEEAGRVPDEKYRPTTGKSPEEYCRDILGGEVVDINAVKYCQYKSEGGGALKELMPLDQLPV